jgi:hypothetical protein
VGWRTRSIPSQLWPGWERSRCSAGWALREGIPGRKVLDALH